LSDLASSSKRCSVEDNLSSRTSFVVIRVADLLVVARILTAEFQLQRGLSVRPRVARPLSRATEGASGRGGLPKLSYQMRLPKELEFLLLAYRTIIYTIRQASGIRLLNNNGLKCLSTG
jgi:hypothetical protein